MTYILLVVFCVFCAAASYRRFRSPLHPHFVFTMSWVFLLPLSAVFNQSVPSYIEELLSTDAGEVAKNHVIVLAFLSVLFGITMFVPRVSFRATTSVVTRSLFLAPHNATVLAAVGLGILCLQVGAQLYACDWSPFLWFEYMIGPRFGRPWLGGYIGGADFVFVLIGNLFFASSLLLPLAFAGTKSLVRLTVGCGELLTLFMLISNGSRTTVALTSLVIALLWQFSSHGRITKIIGHVILFSTLAMVTSVMLRYRSEGYASSRVRDVDPSEIHYGQDDNYYRLIRIMSLADSGTIAYWNASSFLTSSVVNPIPRYFWPNKPLLTQEFFGDWKPYFITISFAGECIAMFGKWLGLALATLIGLAYYRLLVWAYRLITKQFGAAAYLTTCFYVFMAERSIQNIGMNAVIIIFVMALFYWFQQQPASRTRTPAAKRLSRLTPRAHPGAIGFTR